MMLKTLGKKFAAVAMAVSMAMGGFAAYAPAATVEAANDQNTLTQPAIQENNVVVGEDRDVKIVEFCLVVIIFPAASLHREHHSGRDTYLLSNAILGNGTCNETYLGLGVISLSDT